MKTVGQVATCGVDGIKIHQLVVYKDTPLETDYRTGKLTVLDEDNYVELVADSLELLPPHMVIMRLVAEGHKDEIVAPTWSFHKDRVLNKINHILTDRNTHQGIRYRTPQH
ncbi:MAG: hypothetical protein HY711_09865 [Candidatus Melainabacteria bacterium]|nr:hypothetical protein [Candidatus Melainabacteria bacterium]